MYESQKIALDVNNKQRNRFAQQCGYTRFGFYFTLFSILLLLSLGSYIRICQSQNVPDPHLCTISGQVTDKQNNPLSEYIVSTVMPKDNVTYAVKTDSVGQFSLRNLPVGTWNVEVRHLSTLLTQREVPVVGETEVNFVIEGTGIISGFIYEFDKELPLEINDDIKVAHLADDGQRIMGIYKGKVTEGYFEVRDLLPGSYRIIDAFDGYIFSVSDHPMITVYPQGRVEGTEVYLKKGSSVHGAFIDAESGQPISGALVSIASDKKISIYTDWTSAHETETNSKGEFRFSTPNNSDTYYAFTVVASHPRYQTHRWRREMIPEKDQYALGELKLKSFLSLRGTVSPSKSIGTVEGLTVRLKMHDKPAEFFRAAANPEHTVRTDNEGKFLFTELHPIDYSLTISQDDVIIAYLESVNPQAEKPLLIHLPKLRTFRGKVVDTQQGPISGVQLIVSRNSDSLYGHGTLLVTTQTDINGTFEMQVLETDPHLQSVEVSKKGYLSRVYPNPKINKEPLIVTLENGYSIKGRVVLPQHVPTDSYYDVKVLTEDSAITPTLNPLSLNRPLMSKRFGASEETFVLDGLFQEKYTIYITGEYIGATGIDVEATAEGEEAWIVAEQSTLTLMGQVMWTDTDEPVKNALVRRSWYPWDLDRYDMSMTLDRFETETDAEGRFAFSDLTQGPYQLHIRAVNTVWNKEAGKYQRVYIQKQVDIPRCSENTHSIYLGKVDGTPFTNDE